MSFRLGQFTQRRLPFRYSKPNIFRMCVCTRWFTLETFQTRLYEADWYVFRMGRKQGIRNEYIWDSFELRSYFRLIINIMRVPTANFNYSENHIFIKCILFIFIKITHTLITLHKAHGLELYWVDLKKLKKNVPRNTLRVYMSLAKTLIRYWITTRGNLTKTILINITIQFCIYIICSCYIVA